MNSENMLTTQQWIAASEALQSPNAATQPADAHNAFVRFDEILDLQNNTPPESLLMDLSDSLLNGEMLIVNTKAGYIITNKLSSETNKPKQR